MRCRQPYARARYLMPIRYRMQQGCGRLDFFFHVFYFYFYFLSSIAIVERLA